MTFKHPRTVLVAAACLAGLAAWAAGASPIAAPPADDPVAARIDDTVIRRSDLVIALELLPAQYRKMPLEAIYPWLLRQVVDNTLVVRAARGQGLDKSDAIRQRIAAIERRLIEAAYLEEAARGKVTDQALRERYEKVKEARRGKEELRVRHILVKTRGEAARLIERLGDGADFAELAREHSIGPAKSRGGDLGFLAREAMLEPFAEVAFGLETGQVGPLPVETRFGWHVVKVEARRAMKIPSFEEMRPRLAHQIRARIADDLVKSLRRAARIQLYGIDGKPLPDTAAR